MKYIHFFVATVIALIVSVAHASDDNCTYAQSVLGVDGQRLQLIGAGVRTYWWKPINAVALYAPQMSTSWDAIAGSNGEVRADVVFFVERLSGEQLRASWKERFDVLVERHQRAALDSSINAFLDLFADASRGDNLSFSSTTGGLALSLNGVRLGQVGDLAFGRLVLSSWFGSRPASADLKAAVFAGRTVKRLPCGK